MSNTFAHGVFIVHGVGSARAPMRVEADNSVAAGRRWAEDYGNPEGGRLDVVVTTETGVAATHTYYPETRIEWVFSAMRWHNGDER